MSAEAAFAELNGFLADDPENPSLLADTAEAAYHAGRFVEAITLIDRCATLTSLSPKLRHLAGLSAMGQQDWAAASAHFAAMRAAGDDGPSPRFNLAWSRAMLGDKEEASALLDAETIATLPQAAQLKLQLLHERGDLQGAANVAREALALFPDHRGLNAAASTLAIDMEDMELARATAAKAPDHPEAMITQATLALADQDVVSARRLFDEALAKSPQSARAWVGRGLVGLTSDRMTAAADLDKGAELFGTHLGSWIAAGWAHLLAGDLSTAEARFARAMALDDGFAEAHGSVAVVKLMRGDIAQAKRSTAIAQRLDGASFTGALAGALLAASAGNERQAERIVKIALETPVDDRGTTIAQALARLGSVGR